MTAPKAVGGASVEGLKRRLLEQIRGAVRFDEPLKRYTTYRIGGPADIFVDAASEEDVVNTLDAAREFGVPVYVMGAGSNLLVSDRGVRGIVLRLGPSLGEISFSGETVKAQAGASLPKLAKLAADRGLSGLEWAGGVPGTVGGAVAMNAGAHGGEISKILTGAALVSRAGRRLFAGPEEMEYSYRRSGLIRREGHVVLAAEFRLVRDDRRAILERMKRYAARRRSTQPLGMPSSGSVFKNPPGDYAGRLIEAANLKGTRIGGAEISTVHGNFIVNRGDASAEDVKRLIDLVRSTIRDMFGIELELEVELVGWDGA